MSGFWCCILTFILGAIAGAVVCLAILMTDMTDGEEDAPHEPREKTDTLLRE